METSPELSYNDDTAPVTGEHDVLPHSDSWKMKVPAQGSGPRFERSPLPGSTPHGDPGSYR